MANLVYNSVPPLHYLKIFPWKQAIKFTFFADIFISLYFSRTCDLKKPRNLFKKHPINIA
ncbi:MAG: hypothetical protein CO021_05825 [Deltaproteobacteria bacterium CG_4_9_14_0_2_um_filter_42_21]|nr:MAG: hypothetical protein CO021_05825 [Deltaproteobacteria bacterium CG_4_9_14_0_2_um_filter_42_21]